MYVSNNKTSENIKQKLIQLKEEIGKSTTIIVEEITLFSY
jgi:hypothetical protein